jgi:hypothetical protein
MEYLFAQAHFVHTLEHVLVVVVTREEVSLEFHPGYIVPGVHAHAFLQDAASELEWGIGQVAQIDIELHGVG